MDQPRSVFSFIHSLCFFHNPPSKFAPNTAGIPTESKSRSPGLQLVDQLLNSLFASLHRTPYAGKWCDETIYPSGALALRFYTRVRSSLFIYRRESKLIDKSRLGTNKRVRPSDTTVTLVRQLASPYSFRSFSSTTIRAFRRLEPLWHDDSTP